MYINIAQYIKARSIFYCVLDKTPYFAIAKSQKIIAASILLLKKNLLVKESSLLRR